MKAKYQQDLDFEIVFYEGVLRKAPDFVQALMALGDLYTKKGLHDKGLIVDRKLAVLRPDDPYVFYNLACSYSLLGRTEEAFAAIKTAFQNGYDDFQYLEKDADLEKLLQDGRFRDFLLDAKAQRSKQPEPRKP